MKDKNIPGMELVGKDGELLLYATPDRSEGLLYNSVTNRIGSRQPLQVFFKWGNFEGVNPMPLGQMVAQEQV